jgi:hypothetical protein
MRRLAVIVVTLAAVTAAVAAVSPAGAVTVQAAPGNVRCTSRGEIVQGAYRLYNDNFAVPGDRMCIRDDGTGELTVRTDEAAYEGRVVAYPAVQYGVWPGYRDSESGMPMSAAKAGKMMLHVKSTGKARGLWQSDIDLWMWPSAWDVLHGVSASLEIVIINRASDHTAVTSRAEIFHRSYLKSSWMTCDRGSNGACSGSSWRLAYFRLVDQDSSVRYYLAAFLTYCRKMNWLPSTWVVGEVSYGTEIWSYGKGITDDFFITG